MEFKILFSHLFNVGLSLWIGSFDLGKFQYSNLRLFILKGALNIDVVLPSKLCFIFHILLF